MPSTVITMEGRRLQEDEAGPGPWEAAAREVELEAAARFAERVTSEVSDERSE